MIIILVIRWDTISAYENGHLKSIMSRNPKFKLIKMVKCHLMGPLLRIRGVSYSKVKENGRLARARARGKSRKRNGAVGHRGARV